MTRLSFWDIQVEIDERVTRKWYAQAEMWGCTCAYCRNYLKIAEERKLPIPVLTMLGDLGIPPENATYVCNNFSDEKGFHYQFSYRMAGRILNDNTCRMIFQDWGECDCGHETYPYGAPEFPEPHFDLEFYVTLPWVLDEPADGR